MTSSRSHYLGRDTMPLKRDSRQMCRYATLEKRRVTSKITLTKSVFKDHDKNIVETSIERKPFRINQIKNGYIVTR